MAAHKDRVAVIDGCRTPFLRSGTQFAGLMQWEIGRYAVQGIVAKTGVRTKDIHHVIMGTLFREVETTNVARECALGAGMPSSIPAHTCTVACISANAAITDGSGLIVQGDADAVIAGGVEKFDLQNLPPLVEYSVGSSMGEGGEHLARIMNISRQEQDEFAVMSHQRAVKGQKSGWFDKEIQPVVVPGSGAAVTCDNGPRGDTTMEKAAKLKPAFDREHGTVTAANASFLTDGAAVVLLMGEDRAKAEGFKPRAYIKSFTYTAQDARDGLLLGPAYAIPKLLKRLGMKLPEIGVFEIHEAFGVQMVANLRLLASREFCSEVHGLPVAVGEIDMNTLNIYGGSLSIGHPFAATGARLMTTCVNRMIAEDRQFGIIAGCAAGGIGSAILLERA